jgi:hypothetical protein
MCHAPLQAHLPQQMQMQVQVQVQMRRLLQQVLALLHVRRLFAAGKRCRAAVRMSRRQPAMTARTSIGGT